MKSRVRAFITGGAVFALLGIAAKAIGAFYRIPLTGIMGAEGIGLYQMVFPLYGVLLTISGGGLPSAISKTISAFEKENACINGRRTLKVSLAVIGALGLVFSLLLALFRDKIAAVQGNPDAAVAYLGIAPAVALVAVISCFRGYFQGRMNMLPSGVSQIVEQTVKMFLGLYLCSKLLPFGVPYAALGALLGVSLSELAAALLLIAFYAFEKTNSEPCPHSRFERKEAAMETAAFVAVSEPNPLKRSTILSLILKIAFPITLGSLVMPLSSVIDSILVINILALSGESVSVATKYYGILNGPVGSLVNMPVVITTSLSVMLLPKIGALKTDTAARRATAEKFFRVSFSVAIACSAALMLFSTEVLQLLYSHTLSAELIEIGSQLLKISALSIVYMSLLLPTTAVLQGCDKPFLPVVNLLAGVVLKAMLTALLVGKIGIYGACIASVCCFSFTCILDVFALKRTIRISPCGNKFLPSVALSTIAFVIIAFGTKFLAGKIFPAPITLFVSVASGFAAYGILIAATKGLRKTDIAALCSP